MPQIKISAVIAVSSEDTDNDCLALNLLKSGEYKKWKCNHWEPSVNVILKLSEMSKIDSIEIGNECSAFIEILVSRSDVTPQRFQVLLSTSSFMTPSESKSMENTNRVRMFNRDKLSPNAVNENWDLIKIVCAQPFNKNSTFGLAFIRFNSPPIQENDDDPLCSSSSFNIGPFSLINNNNNNNKFSAGSLFANRTRNGTSYGASSNVKSPNPLSLSAAIGVKKTDTKTNTKTITNAVVNDDNKKPKIDDSKRFSNDSKSPENKVKVPQQSPNVHKRTPNNSQPKDSPIPKASTSKHNDTPPQKRSKKHVPFNKLMSKVVFVLSGYVNPQRGQLRDKAIAMGAKYKGNWDPMCTHLICAFINTPKYHEVIQKSGRIVTDKWINDCFAQKTLLQWKNYKLGNYKSPPSSDNDSDHEDDDTVPVTVKYVDIDDDDDDNNDLQRQNDDNDPIYDADTDKEME